MTGTERSQKLFSIWGAFIPILPNCDPFVLSPCCTTHMKVFTCTILSGKTRHLARPQGNHLQKCFTYSVSLEYDSVSSSVQFLDMTIGSWFLILSNIMGTFEGHSWKLRWEVTVQSNRPLQGKLWL